MYTESSVKVILEAVMKEEGRESRKGGVCKCVLMDSWPPCVSALHALVQESPGAQFRVTPQSDKEAAEFLNNSHSFLSECFPWVFIPWNFRPNPCANWPCSCDQERSPGRKTQVLEVEIQLSAQDLTGKCTGDLEHLLTLGWGLTLPVGPVIVTCVFFQPLALNHSITSITLCCSDFLESAFTP